MKNANSALNLPFYKYSSKKNKNCWQGQQGRTSALGTLEAMSLPDLMTRTQFPAAQAQKMLFSLLFPFKQNLKFKENKHNANILQRLQIVKQRRVTHLHICFAPWTIQG